MMWASSVTWVIVDTTVMHMAIHLTDSGRFERSRQHLGKLTIDNTLPAVRTTTEQRPGLLSRLVGMSIPSNAGA